MKIEFIVTPYEDDNDGAYETYEATISFEDLLSAEIRLKASSDECSYDEFKANIFQDLLEALADASGSVFEVTEDVDDSDLIDAVFELDDEDLAFGFRIDEGDGD